MGHHKMEEKAKSRDDHHSALRTKLKEKVKDDPEFARKQDAAERVTDRFSETFHQLANFRPAHSTPAQLFHRSCKAFSLPLRLTV